jgi:hypothetical protein
MDLYRCDGFKDRQGRNNQSFRRPSRTKGENTLKASPLRILLGLVLGVALGYLCVKSRSPMLARIPGIVAPVGTLFISAI